MSTVRNLQVAETDVVEVSDEILYSNALIMKLCKSTIFPYIMKFGKEERVTKVASSIQRELLLDNRKYKMSIKMAIHSLYKQLTYFEDQDAIDISTILQCRFRGTKRKKHCT